MLKTRSCRRLASQEPFFRSAAITCCWTATWRKCTESRPGSSIRPFGRNPKRFPDGFSFRLTAAEQESLRSQTVTLKSGRGQHRKYLPYVFTEQGVAMLSSVLHSDRAIEVNIAIMRAFVRLREILSTHKDLAAKLEKMDRKLGEPTSTFASSSRPSAS